MRVIIWGARRLAVVIAGVLVCGGCSGPKTTVPACPAHRQPRLFRSAAIPLTR